MTVLVTADLHLTDQPYDEYRWGIFDWLSGQCEACNACGVLILGDLTDKKDGHTARMVNRLVAHISELGSRTTVYLLKGNHDYTDPNIPFFGFTDLLGGVNYIHHPRSVASLGDIGSVLFVPHMTDKAFAETVSDMKLIRRHRLICLHQKLQGACSGGRELTGATVPNNGRDHDDRLWLSGDIHQPQRVQGVEYVGSPYHTRFGEDHKPRVILLDRCLRIHDLHYPAPSKRTLEVRANRTSLIARQGDHVRIRILVQRLDLAQIDRIRADVVAQCESRGLVLRGVETVLESEADRGESLDYSSASVNDEQIVVEFAERESVGNRVLQQGLELIDAQKGVESQ